MAKRFSDDGTRLTDCCGAYSSFDDFGDLYCKCCYKQVTTGQGDGCEVRHGLTLDEIRNAVESGHTVHWSHEGYVVLKDSIGQWLIKCLSNGSCIGLTWQDGVTVNGTPEQFYIGN